MPWSATRCIGEANDLWPHVLGRDKKEVWDIRHGKTSLRADYVWMRPSTQSAPEDL